jgi:hypothetical protein
MESFAQIIFDPPWGVFEELFNKLEHLFFEDVLLSHRNQSIYYVHSDKILVIFNEFSQNILDFIVKTKFDIILEFEYESGILWDFWRQIF